MRSLLKNERFIIITYSLILVAAILVLLTFEKTKIHLFINRNSNETLDFVFKHLTLLGEGLFIILVCILLLFHKYKTAITQALAFVLSGIVAQLLKHFVFSGCLRPNLYFKNFPEYTLRFVNGVDIANYNSFPSGHTASAFAMFFVFIFMLKNRWMKLFLLIIAMFVGYSRMYLSQHFLIDVTFGSLIGVVSAIITCSFMGRYNNKHLENSIIKTH